MPQSQPERYTARICWNSKGWRFPTGEAAHLETGSYVTNMGFGHEEWLFNFAWLIDGMHYAFLQPVNNSFENMTGKVIDVLLYAINPDRDRLYVGTISNCEVLQRTQAEDAVEVYKKHGWLESMVEQVVKVGGEADGILNSSEARDLFNVRFRREDANIYDPLRIANRGDGVWKRSRYTLAATNEQIQEQWRTRKGQTSPPLINTINRIGTPGVTYDPLEKRLQAALFPLFEARYGKGNVKLEEDYVDITVADGKQTILSELKSNPTARGAIREAMGQLLEYAYYWPRRQIEELRLVIVAPGNLDKLAEAYVERLRTEFNLPIAYCCHSEGDPLPGMFAKSSLP